MTKLKSNLSFLLALQLVLAIGIYWANLQVDSDKPEKPLLAFDANSVDKIKITADKDSLELEKNNGQWQLPQAENLPANDSKIQALISKLNNLKPGWPTTTTTSAHQRFEVADDHFQRQLQLFQGDKIVANLYLGTSPGFRKIHARAAGQDAVYAVALNHYEMPAKSDDWLDKSLLSAHDFTQIKGADYVLSKNADIWTFAGQEPDQQSPTSGVDESKADQLVSAIENLTVQSLASEAPSKSPTAIEISGNNQNHRYEFVEDGEHYYVKRDDRENWFNLSKFDYEKIVPIDKQHLAEQTETTESKVKEQPAKS